MSPVPVEVATSRLGFPRVSGDEPAAKEDIAAAREFSPRERG